MIVPGGYVANWQPRGFEPIFGTHAKALLFDGKGRLLLTNGGKVPLPYGVVENLSWKGDGANYDAWRYRDVALPGASVAVYNVINTITQDYFTLNTRTFAFEKDNIPTNRTDDSQVYAVKSSQAMCYDVESDETLAYLRATTSAVALPNASWTYALLAQWHAVSTRTPGTMRYTPVEPIDPLNGTIALDASRRVPGFSVWSTLSGVEDMVSLTLRSMVVDNRDATARLGTVASGSGYKINGSASVSSLQTRQYNGALFGWNGRTGGRLVFRVGGAVDVLRAFRRSADLNDELMSFGRALRLRLVLWRSTQQDSSALTMDDASPVATVMPRFERVQSIDLCALDGEIRHEALRLAVEDGVSVEMDANCLYFFRLEIDGEQVRVEDEIDESAALPLDGASMSVSDFLQIEAEAQLTLAPVA